MAKKLNMNINFNQISVNAIDDASGIYVGNNIQLAWSTHNKSNSGYGTAVGNYNQFLNNMNIVNDEDFIDAPIDDRDIVISKM